MRRIGEKVGDAEVSPALAWLLESASEVGPRNTRKDTEGSRWDYPRWPRLKNGVRGHGSLGAPRYEAGVGDGSRALPATPNGVVVRAEAPSPVVIDFIAGADTQPAKSWLGYWVGGEFREQAGAPRLRSGAGVVVLYNFGSEPAEVRIEQIFDAKGANDEPRAGAIEGAFAPLVLAPGERREIPVRLWARADAFVPNEVAIAAEVRSGGVHTVSRWSTRVYAAPAADYGELGRRGFGFSTAEGQANREHLLARPYAEGEPRLKPQGRWLVSEGVKIEETVRGWRIHVQHFPGDPYRPAMVELPLPEGWRMEAGEMLGYDYRLVPVAGAGELRSDEPDPRLRRQSGVAGSQAESYIRTRNGNLYSTVPRLEPKAEWQRYLQGAETLTLLFMGRAAQPWRFLDNEPASLVFFVRPATLPAVLEIRDPQVVRFGLPTTSD
jgi:hypothetical protein